MKILSDLFLHSLHDVYFAEKAITKSLPDMIKKASNEDLQTALEKHLEETEWHVDRLKDIFEILELPAKAEECPAIEGIIKEAKETMKEVEDAVLLDIVIIWMSQKIENYEIWTYRSLIEYAKALEYSDVLEILQETLEEEQHADKVLWSIGKSLYADAV